MLSLISATLLLVAPRVPKWRRAVHIHLLRITSISPHYTNKSCGAFVSVNIDLHMETI